MALKFVYPEFLFALFLLSIPVIIHLFNFRRFKKIFFTNVRFLIEVKEETTSRSKLKHFLVLFARLMAVIFLVLGFAQPYLPADKLSKITNNRAVSIFVDNSFSMESNGREGTLLNEAKTKALEISKAYQPSDQFQLLTCDFEPTHQRLVNREEFFDLLDQIKISPAAKNLSEIISRQSEALNHAGATERSAFVLSDFQQSSTDLMNCHPDSSIQITLISIKSELRNNVYIDSCWLSSPLVQLNNPCEINVLVKNASPATVENIPLKLSINGIQKSLTSLTISADGTATARMNFTITAPGWQQAQLSLTDYPITFDDQYYFSFDVTQNMHIISINGKKESPYLKALFGSNDYFLLDNSSVSQVDYNVFGKSQLIILNELQEISSGLSDELKKFVANGGSLVIFPDSTLDKQSYHDFMLALKADAYASINTNEDKVSRIDTKSDLFADVFEKVPENMDLPVAQRHFEMTSSTLSNKEVLLKLQGGDPLLSRYLPGKGKVYVFTVPLSPGFSGLARHAVFVPLMYKIALLSKLSIAMSYIISRNSSVNIGNIQVGGEDVFHLLNEAGKIDIIPGHRNDPSGTVVDIPFEVRDAGNYNLNYKGKVNAVISMNFDRKESAMQTLTTDQLNNQIDAGGLFNFKTMAPDTPDITKSLRELNEGKRLWKWCIILALLFLTTEILLLKFLK